MVTLLWVMLGSISLGVFFRYFLGDAIVWSEEVARFSMVWVSFLAGSLTFRLGGHVAILYFRDLLPKPLDRAAGTLTAMIIAAFLLVLIVTGAQMVAQVAEQRSAALEISMAIPYSALPIGGILMLYQMIRVLLVTGTISVRSDSDEPPLNAE